MTDRKRPGRPRVHPGDRPAADVHLKLSADDYDRAYQLATRRRETIQALLRRGLRRELENPPR
jgi:hypothetical protein